MFSTTKLLNSDKTANQAKLDQALMEHIRGLSNVVTIYAVSFMFWLSMWVNNDGPGGVDGGLLTMAALGHLFMIAIHINQAFQSEKDIEQSKK